MLPGILAGHVDIEGVMGMLDDGDAQAVFQQMRNRPRQQGGLAGAAPSREAYHFHFILRRRARTRDLVTPGPVPGIHVFTLAEKDVDGRDKPGHDE
jgi:hypothetical protein